MYNQLKPVLSVVLATLLTVGLHAQTSPAAQSKPVEKANAQVLMIKGVVKNAATGNGINGAQLQVKGFSAAIADTAGNFSLKIPNTTATILVEADGFDAQLIPVKYRSKVEVLLLSRTIQSYHNVLVMPVSNQPKKNITASTDQQRPDGWQQPTETIDAWLQGRVAGLNSIRRSGLQGAGANLFLNGINSLYATNKPLIVVDGMPFDANEYGESIIANNYTNPLSLIDIKDIDNITVLKDASGIYGAKGGNGAIIITTVSAEGKQATKIDAAVYAGVNLAPGNLPVLNATDYRTHLSRMLSSRGWSVNQIGSQPYMNDDPVSPGYYTYHNNTDWQRKVMDNSFSQNAYLRITGGDNIATYGLTVGYMKNSGIVRNTNLERYHTRFNADFNFTEKLTGTANLSFTYNTQDLKDQGIADKTAPLFNALVKAPFLTDHILAADGTASPNLEGVDTLGIGNPSAIIDKIESYNKFYRFAGSFKFKYAISKHLAASTLIGLQFDKIRENFFVPSQGIVQDTLWNDIANNRMGSQVKQLFSLFNDTRLDYTKTFGYVHSLNASLGVRYQNNKANQVNVITANSATDDLVSVQNGLAALRRVGGEMGEWNWLNTYLGADYGFRDKIFLSLNMALDGSSRFGVKAANGLTIGGHQFPLFPSIAAAWLLSSEKFMSASSINLLKLRASYTISGNDDIGNYTARYIYASQNLLGAQGSVRKWISNPELQWETVRKLNAGVDLTFWQERVNFGLDIYANRTTNMLVYQPLQSVAGFSTALTNGGELQNKGVEANLNIRLINKRRLKWDFGANIATYKNEILKVPGNAVYTDWAGATIITAMGKPANQFYGFQTDGVFISDAAAAQAGLTTEKKDGSFTPFKGGDMRFVDQNGDKIIDDRDRVVIGDPNPDFFGGFTNRLIVNRFELNALLTFSVGNEVFNYLRYRLESQSGVENQLQSVANSWRVDGQQTSIPKATWGDPMGNNRFSDRWIEDGSYLRLRSLNLTYNVPLKATAAFKSIAVSVTGTNLFTATKYLGYDPEFSANASPLSQGIDTGLDPLFKSLMLGLRLGL
ncbi:SusC/RagA family TonB-linked outer membrane protein [Niabella sp. 22666]|uniref:SusC/RagA family TonB-linked outer membrane protein n=1 Tax=Niabella sp. 22666 TaxID=3453954 RepID=UPI003F82D3EF